MYSVAVVAYQFIFELKNKTEINHMPRATFAAGADSPFEIVLTSKGQIRAPHRRTGHVS